MKAKTENKKPQIINDYKMMLYKLDNRPGMRDDQKIKALDELAVKFSKGWPFTQANPLAQYGSGDGFHNELEKVAKTLSERIRRQQLIREGRDIGKFDRTELDSNHVFGAKKPTDKPVKETEAVPA